MAALQLAFAKLQTLSERRAQRVVDLIEDLTELEAWESIENERDIADAKAIIAEIGDDIEGKTVPWEKLKADLDALHGFDRSTG